MRNLAIISIAASVIAGQAQALDLIDCKRTTHPSHGGEIRHTDLGEERVMWIDWWSQEGTAKSISMVECASGETLRFRMAEENMGRRAMFDRTDDVIDILERHQSGARVFATFERIAADLDNIARDIEIATLTQETCACAAAYPELRGEKTEFQLAG
ncbi:hypothetical protein N9E38_00450 [Yoonia sp.]|uniref:hypothetical protein n=1 Tax=Yoonia sp. TaxID=2212373 RepID=UPI00231AFBDB|nr:hypothetical protein [Yoonia sp.]MDA9979890.1 hypothetical protein [Yoonia sp.]MDC1399312.1 hypothetical protein [Yoonia sp.]